MPASSVSGNYSPDMGVLIDVGIMFRADQGEVGDVAFFRALVDSGASHTNISGKVVEALGLIPAGEIRRRTPAGIDTADVFEVRVKLADNVEVFVTAPEYDSSSPEHDILLGRDVICLGDFHMLGDGTFELVFPDIDKKPHIDSP